MKTGAITLAKPDKKKTISFDSRASAYFRKKKSLKNGNLYSKFMCFLHFFHFSE